MTMTVVRVIYFTHLSDGVVVLPYRIMSKTKMVRSDMYMVWHNVFHI